jgi:hypothetical protein
MNKEVNFEIAKLLKEKGFNLPTRSYRQKSAVIGSEKILPLVSVEEPYDWNNYSSEVPYYSMPIIAEVVMWLYEKHGIWISVGGDDNKTFKYELHIWSYYEPEKTLRQGHVKLGDTLFDVYSQPYKTSTEAYEAAIKYTLESLI